MPQTRTRPRRSLSFDVDALTFLERYAEERGIKLSTALSELLLHIAGQDKANPDLVRAALSKTATLGANE